MGLCDDAELCVWQRWEGVAAKESKLERRRRLAGWVREHVIPHEPAVRAWLARARTPPEEIDELIQESYSRLAALDTVEHIDRPGAYFFSIARNLLFRRLRRARLVPIEAIAEIDAFHDYSQPSPEHAAGAQLDYKRLLAMIDALPKRQRQIVRMRKLDGYSQREIAAVLNISESVVENEIFKGVRAVQLAWKHGEAVTMARLAEFEQRAVE